MNAYRRWIQHLFSAGLAAVLALSAAYSQADETITYIHWDAQGSPVAATDEDGNVVWRESYRPYGQRINNEAAAGLHTRWYTGHPQDPDTGLVYAGARYYDPVIGRFLAIDPVELQEDNLHSFNRYAYGNNNPYRYVDPDGRSPELLFITDPQAYMAGVMAPQLGVDANTRSGNRAIRKQMQREAGAELLGIGVGIGLGKAAGRIAGRTNTKRVGRHMSPDELAKMRKTGRVQEGGGGQTRVVDPPNPGTYKNPPRNDVYVEFDVRANRVLTHSKGTGRIPGPSSPDARVPGRNPDDFEMPPATNIRVFE